MLKTLDMDLTLLCARPQVCSSRQYVPVNESSTYLALRIVVC